MFSLALRNVFRHRLRTLLTLAAIVSGVMAIVISGGFIEDTFVQLRESTIHSRVGHLQVFRQGYLEHGQRDPFAYLIAEPVRTAEVVAELPHVEDVMARTGFSGLANNGRADIPILGEGIEPDKEARLGSAMTIVAGRQLSDADAYGGVIGEGVGAALNLEPGDYLTLMVNTAEGALNTIDVEIVGIFRSVSKDYDDRAVRIPIAAAHELMFSDATHTLVVALDATAATDEVVAAVRSRLQGTDLEVRPWHELAGFYRKTVALYQRQFGVLQGIILMLLVLSVSSTVNMTLYERTGEFGTLLALGKRRRDLFRLIMLENTLLGVIGGLLGLLLGAALALGISRIGIPMPPPPGSNAGYLASIRLVPWVMLVAAVTGMLATILAAVLPARRAVHAHVADALRHNV